MVWILVGFQIQPLPMKAEATMFKYIFLKFNYCVSHLLTFLVFAIGCILQGSGACADVQLFLPCFSISCKALLTLIYVSGCMQAWKKGAGRQGDIGHPWNVHPICSDHTTEVSPILCQIPDMEFGLRPCWAVQFPSQCLPCFIVSACWSNQQLLWSVRNASWTLFMDVISIASKGLKKKSSLSHLKKKAIKQYKYVGECLWLLFFFPNMWQKHFYSAAEGFSCGAEFAYCIIPELEQTVSWQMFRGIPRGDAFCCADWVLFPSFQDHPVLMLPLALQVLFGCLEGERERERVCS